MAVIEGARERIRTAVTQLTNTQIKALQATPIQLVADPGDGYAVLVEGVLMYLDVTTTGYTETADNLAIEYVGGTDILTVETTGFLDQATDQIRYARPAIALTTPVASAAVQIINNGDAEFGGGNAANTLSIEVEYRIVKAAAFVN